LTVTIRKPLRCKVGLHKWYTPTCGYRICMICGLTQRIYIYGWGYCDPKTWRGNVCYYKKIRSKKKKENDIEKKKLLKEIREKGTVWKENVV